MYILGSNAFFTAENINLYSVDKFHTFRLKKKNSLIRCNSEGSGPKSLG